MILLKRSCIIAFSFILFFSCGESRQENLQKNAGATERTFVPDCKVLAAEARRMDSLLLSSLEIDTAEARFAIRAFTDFAYHCHRDSMSGVYLIKIAQVAKAINNIPQAKLALDRCIDDYRDFSGRPAALFLLAQLYDEPTHMNNEYEAQKIYERIIDEYPGSEWAQSAKGAIKFIGKTDEDILRELKKKSK
jgi:hypothetical protein